MKRSLWILPALILGLGYWVWLAVPAAIAPEVRLDPTRARPQGDFFVGAFPRPADLNPFTTDETVARRYVLRYTHDALMELDPRTGELRPALAISMTRSADGRSAVFDLRENVLFSDGSPLTMADVLFTWEAGSDPSLPLGALAEVIDQIESVEPLDDRRLRVSLRVPSARGLGIVATRYVVTKREHFAPRPSAVREPGPGTGPYTLASHDDTVLDLVQNPHSWRRGALPEAWNLAGLKLRFAGDRAAQFVALRRQEIDWMMDPAPEELLRSDPELAANYRALVFDHQNLGHYVIVWNHRRPGLGDRRVRGALTRLFDRQAIVETLFGGHAQPASTWFKPGSEGHPDDLEPLPFDPVAARQLLADAGYDPDAGRPLRLSLIFAAGDDLQRRIVELARPAMARAGVELEPRPLAWTAMRDRLVARDFDAMLVVVGLERWVDPYFVFHSSQGERGRNWMGYRDAEVDRLLENARGEFDDEKRAAQYRAFSRLFWRDQPVTLLAHPLAAVLLHRRFRGVEPGVLGLYPELWWVEPGERRY